MGNTVLGNMVLGKYGFGKYCFEKYGFGTYCFRKYGFRKYSFRSRLFRGKVYPLIKCQVILCTNLISDFWMAMEICIYLLDTLSSCLEPFPDQHHLTYNYYPCNTDFATFLPCFPIGLVFLVACLHDLPPPWKLLLLPIVGIIITNHRNNHYQP